MRYLLAACFVAFSAVSSWTLAGLSESDSLSQLVGGAFGDAKCKNDCDDSATAEKGECFHSGWSDPCSTITCILNIYKLPKCSTQDSGGVACPVTGGYYLGRKAYDQACSGTSAWEMIEVQAEGDCQPQITRGVRCLNACGGGTATATANRYLVVCQ